MKPPSGAGSSESGLGPLGSILGGALLLILVVPLLGLLAGAGPRDLAAGIRHPLFLSALSLSFRTSVLSLFVLVLLGSPLAWWLATSRSRWVRWIEPLVDLPIIVPPAVVGVALLQTFGRRGLLGSTLEGFGVVLPFSEAAVVLAQLVVAAPFYVQAAASAFKKVDRDLLIVARTLGASSWAAFFRVAVPLALPGVVAGASLAWARALGEFGATLLFAGSFPGTTQTMPLAIYAALESDVRLAVVFSLILAALGVVLLLGVRVFPALGQKRWKQSRRESKE